MSERAFIRFGDDARDVQFFGNAMQPVECLWRELEPAPSVFDFEACRRRIAARSSDGGRFAIELHIKGAVWDVLYARCREAALGAGACPCVQRCASAACDFVHDGDARAGSAPDWLVERFNVSLELLSAKCDADRAFRIVNVDTWDDVYHEHFGELVGELAKSGIPANSDVRVVYLHGPSQTRGEEGTGWPRDDGARLETMRRRLRWWAEAFGEHVGKLALPLHSGALLHDALALGIGQRSGQVELYTSNAENPLLCQTLTADRHMRVLDDCAALRDARVFGDENEEYDVDWAQRYGPIEHFAHRYRESMLRVLQACLQRKEETSDRRTHECVVCSYSVN